MAARLSRRSFLGAAGAATLTAALPERTIGAVPSRTAQAGREAAVRDTAYLYERPS